MNSTKYFSIDVYVYKRNESRSSKTHKSCYFYTYRNKIPKCIIYISKKFYLVEFTKEYNEIDF